jgi:hypothetical protein
MPGIDQRAETIQNAKAKALKKPADFSLQDRTLRA